MSSSKFTSFSIPNTILKVMAQTVQVSIHQCITSVLTEQGRSWRCSTSSLPVPSHLACIERENTRLWLLNHTSLLGVDKKSLSVIEIREVDIWGCKTSMLASTVCLRTAADESLQL